MKHTRYYRKRTYSTNFPDLKWTPPSNIRQEIKTFLDNYFDKYIADSTLKINEPSSNYLKEEESKISELLKKEISRHKEEVIDKAIIYTIQELNIPIITELIGEMKTYLMTKIQLKNASTLEEFNKQPLISQNLSSKFENCDRTASRAPRPLHKEEISDDYIKEKIKEIKI